MASEKITITRTNDNKTGVIEQYPKTITSQVYDIENEQFLNQTIEDLKNNGGGGDITWANVLSKPTTFTPSPHTHLWADITDKPTTFSPSTHTHSYNDLTNKPTIVTSVVTTTANGLMSSTDKSKLDGIATGANNYSLPTATNTILGGVRTGTNLTNTSGTISVADATTSVKGVVQLTDSTSSTSTTTAATPSSVKTVNDALVTHNNDYMKHGISATATSVNNYIVTLSPALSTYTKLLKLTLFFDQANTSTTTTVNINGLGAKALKKNNGSGYSVGELKVNTPYSFVYNGTDFLADSSGEGGNSTTDEVTINYVDYYTELSNITKTDNTLNLTNAREYPSSTSIGDYTLIGGGNNSSGPLSVVDAYNTSLVRSTPTALSVARTLISSTTIGNYALFGGGGTLQSPMLTVDAYNTSLVRSTPTALSVSRGSSTATIVGNYALFAGGANTSTAFTTVDAYNTSLVRTTPTALSFGRAYLASTTVGDHALFGGGAYYANVPGGIDFTNTVDAYNTSLVRSVITNLSASRLDLAAKTIGNYALFAGGSSATELLSLIDVYNSTLVKQTNIYMSMGRDELSGTLLNRYVLFGGGGLTEAHATIDIFDRSLARSTNTLSSSRDRLSATTIGNFALFAGGTTTTGLSSLVEVYSNAVYTTIDLTAGSIYKFNNNTTEQTAATNLTLTYTEMVNGYVKIKSGTLTK